MVLQDEIRSGREVYEADAEHDSETVVRYAVGLTDGFRWVWDYLRDWL